MTKEYQQAAINDIQHLHFELFRRIRYNLLDGERVVCDLLEWRNLWYSVCCLSGGIDKYDKRKYA